MEKAYDLKALGLKIIEEAKKEGLPLAEEAVEKLGKAVYLAVKGWAKESAEVSGTKVDDFLARFYDLIDDAVLPQIEKIDLDQDGK